MNLKTSESVKNYTHKKDHIYYGNKFQSNTLEFRLDGTKINGENNT